MLQETGTPSPHGQVVGRYRLERRLGRGGMGEVWLGRDRDTEQPGAVKLLPHHASDVARKQFDREWRAIARLEHPNIVHLHEVGADHIAMAFIDGPSLQRRLQTAIDPGQAIDWTLQIASALQHAHDRGITHRDVKPGNILIDSKHNAYLADFGLAVFDGDLETPRGGTPTYMAPEQWDEGRIGHQADQFALGRTLLAMLLGGSPPRLERALEQLDEQLPEALIDALTRSLQLDPAARWPTVLEFATSLREVDVSALSTRHPLASLKRATEDHAWMHHCVVLDADEHDIARADYRLSQLVEAGWMPQATLESFTEATGYADFGWAVFGRPSRLGPLNEAQCAGRASEVVVLLHGWGCTREVWARIARHLCTDNAELLVLVPDVQGFGESRFSGSWSALRYTSPQGLYATVQKWLGLLALSDLPTVVVGHSMSGAAVLAGSDLPQARHPYRVAIAPAWLETHRLFRWWARLGALVATLLVYLGPAFRLITHDIGSGDSGRRIAPHVQKQMVANMMAAERTAIVRVAAGIALGQTPSPDAIPRTLILVGEEDRMFRLPDAMKAADGAGIPRSHVRVLARASHFPHIEDLEHPEYTARNTAEIVRGIDEMLMSCRDPTVLLQGGTHSAFGTTAPSPDTLVDYLSEES